MTTTPIDNTSITTGFNVDELTEGSLTGKGVFDVLLQTLRLHLDREFTSGRITGTAYATVYSQAITSFLAQASQYALAKAKMPLELQLLQEQVQLTQLQQTKLVADTSLVTQQEAQIVQTTSNMVSQQVQIEAETARIQYQTQYQVPEEIKVIKYNQDKVLAEIDRVTTDIAVAIKQGLLIDAQTCDTRAKTNQTNAEVSLKLPEEVELVKRNYAQVSAQTLLISSQKTVQDKQAQQITAETNKINYENIYKVPEEVKVLKFTQDQLTAQIGKISADTIATSKQGELTDAQVCQVKAQANQINAEVALKLPEEVELIKRNQSQVSAQVDEIIYRSTTLLPSQTAQNTAQTAQITYTTSTVLPANVANVNAQKDSALAQTALYEQKTVTELAQTTTTPASGSAMGMQNLLMERQADNYLRDAEQKAAKIMTETWQVRANADPFGTGNLPNTDNKLTNEDIGDVITKLKTGVGA